MFGAFAVFYLFLGGAGRERLRARSLTFGGETAVRNVGVRPRIFGAPLGRIVDYAILAGFVALRWAS